MLPSDINIGQLCLIARKAGAEILSVYDTEIKVESKDDGSPLTLADKKAHDLIERCLNELTPDIPVLSEESIHIIGDKRLDWQQYWLVDPLDGTKEFIKRNGEFTVNIALIEQGKPVVGVVYAPVLDTMFYAVKGVGAFKQIKTATMTPISSKVLDLASVTVVASRSHMSDEVKQFKSALKSKAQSVELISMGSSLKLCLVADGSADYYPRFGLTSEWDTAAAQCVVEAAGGWVVDSAGVDICYTKKDILNPWFLVIADPSVQVDFSGYQVSA